MSGGHFGGTEFRLIEAADEIQQRITDNDSTALDEYGDPVSRGYDAGVLHRLQEAVAALRRAAVMIRRVDYLLSGDDGPESFLERWDEELNGPIA